MFIASKYEEIYAPELRDFVYITDSAYTGKQIRDTERHMLSTLDHNLGKPLPLHFLRRSSKAGQVGSCHVYCMGALSYSCNTVIILCISETFLSQKKTR